MSTDSDAAKKLLAELLLCNVVKSPALAGKQRRLLAKLSTRDAQCVERP